MQSEMSKRGVNISWLRYYPMSPVTLPVHMLCFFDVKKTSCLSNKESHKEV